MAGEFLGVRLEQGGQTLTVSTAGTLDNYGAENIKSGGSIDVESGGSIDIESGGSLDFESGGILTVVPSTASGSIPALGVTLLTPTTAAATSYALATAQPGSFHLAYCVTGPSTGKSATIDTTSAHFVIGNTTTSTGLLLGSTASTGSPQFALLWGANSTTWVVVAKTSGIVGT